MGLPRRLVHGGDRVMAETRRKPGPKPRVPQLVEGRDYFCGTCTSHRTVACEYCVQGDTTDGRCQDCDGTGRVACPECHGGTVPVPPPADW